MTIKNNLRIAGIAAAVIVFVGAGTSRAEGIKFQPNSICAPVLLSSGGGTTVGSVLDSNRHKSDTTGKWKKDSIDRARKDSIINANHIQDSIHHAKKDSINKANHERDSIEHARKDSIYKANNGGHIKDSINHAREDSLKHAGRKRDTDNKSRVDSLKREAHRRDSIHRVRKEHEKRKRHVRDSIIHERLDSLIKVKRDSTRHGSIDQQGQAGQLGKSAMFQAVPGEAVLAQNYPNPFGGGENITAIDFSLPANQLVQLDVFNAAGQYVTTLASGTLTAGVHSVSFNANNLPAGMYFYKLVTETGVITKRMIKVH